MPSQIEHVHYGWAYFMAATDSSASVGAHKKPVPITTCVGHYLPDVSDTACVDHQTCCQYAAQWTNKYLHATSYGNCHWTTILRLYVASLTILPKKKTHWNYFASFSYSVINKTTDQLHGRFSSVLFWGTIRTLHCTQRIWIQYVNLLTLCNI